MYIQITGIHKRLGDKKVINNISLQVEKGKIIVLLGPSGCGKTTLLNILAGLSDVDNGEIHIGGKLYSAKGYTLPPERRNIGMVFQDFALWPHMNVFENVAFGLRILGFSTVSIKERVSEVLQLVRMHAYADYYPHQLSGGQKQRIAIARAMATRPEVLLMDEPLSSLDAGLREQMRWELLRIIQEAEITAVYVTHDQQEALSMADEIVLLNEGSIQQSGTPVSMYQHPNSGFVATFLGAANLLQGTVEDYRDGISSVTCGGIHVRVPCNQLSPGDQAIVMFRPGEIKSGSDSIESCGASFIAEVKQRAYHGSNWQYRIRTIGALPMELEVWEETERSIGTVHNYYVPLQSCRLIREKEVLNLSGSNN